MTDRYFTIRPNEEYGVAHGLMGRAELRQLTLRLFDAGRIDDWRGARFQSELNDPPDIVWGLRQVRLASDLVRQVFTEHAGMRDDIQWLSAELVSPGGRSHRYWVPHFPRHEDVLDDALTSYGPGGLPIRWVLAPEKLVGLGVFVVPQMGDVYVIHQQVGRALAEAGATGCTSAAARLS